MQCAAVITIRAHIHKTVTSILPSFDAQEQTRPHIANLMLAESEFIKPHAIDLIIGADNYGQISKPSIIKLSPRMLIAQNSIIEWLILGSVYPTYLQSYMAHTTVLQQDDLEMRELLANFWV